MSKPDLTAAPYELGAEAIAWVRKCPHWVASNIEAGGNGACNDGTHVATPLQTASTPDTDAAREMGLVGARESRALACNSAFTPIVDVHHNWR